MLANRLAVFALPLALPLVDFNWILPRTRSSPTLLVAFSDRRWLMILRRRWLIVLYTGLESNSTPELQAARRVPQLVVTAVGF